MTIELPDGRRYAEAHHIRPLGSPHNGPDVAGNILCLCPNHHAELDYGVRPLELNDLRKTNAHAIDEAYVYYHNDSIRRPLLLKARV
jgi:predicted restriction endonuclease